MIGRYLDGDTFTALVDTGFGGRYEARIRVSDLFEPEMAPQPGAVDARDRLIGAFNRVGWGEWSIRIVTMQRVRSISETKSFDRYVSEVYLAIDGTLHNLTDVLRWTDQEDA
jgi:hypothetical protein